jgi:hypothetical protein
MLLASITFSKSKEDCAIIVNNSCNSVISVSGTINGTGAVSGVATSKAIFKGFDNQQVAKFHITHNCFGKHRKHLLYYLSWTRSNCLVRWGIVNLAATPGTSGKWEIVSGPTGGGERFSNLQLQILHFTALILATIY